jgi:hypothetical protein
LFGHLQHFLKLTQVKQVEVDHNLRGESALLDGRDSGTAGNNGGEDVTLHGNTKGERADIEKEEVSGVGGGGLSGEDTGLNGGTVGDGLIGVDALLELLAVEEVGKELLDAGNTGGTTNKDDLVNLGLLNVGILEDLLNGLDGAVEGLGVEVLAVEEGVDLDGGLGTVGKSTLGTLASSSQTTEGTGVTGKVLFKVSIMFVSRLKA